MPQLILIVDGKLKSAIPILGDSLRIGRDSSSPVRIDDPTVSRYHAEIFRRGGAYFLEDKKSTNGTRLNGRLVREQARLDHRDRISIGNAILIFEADASERSDSSRNAFDGAATVYDLKKHK